MTSTVTDRGLIGDSARIALASAMSRATGLARIVVVAAVLGSTVLGDLFVAVNVLPLVLYDVLAGSALSSLLVPPLVRFLDGDDGRRARQFVGNALGLLSAAMVVAVAVAIAARGWIAAALTAGVDRALAGDARSVAGLLLLLIAPQLVLYAAIGVFVSIQHANHHFVLPSAAPVIENLGLIATMVVVGLSYGGGFEVTDVPLGLLLVLGVGSGLSVSTHAVVQLIGAWRAAGRPTVGFNWRDGHVRALVRPARDSFAWSGSIALRQFALIVAAGFAGAGGVQAFEIATLAYFVPLALIGRPIASAALPRLARLSNRGSGSDEVIVGYRAALRLAAVPALAAGGAMVLLSGPLASLVAHGRFDNPETVRLLTYALRGLGLGAASEALFEVARQATMAQGRGQGQGQGQGRNAGLRRSTMVRAGMATVGLPAVVLLLDGPAVLLGLGVVVSIGDVLAFVLADRGLRTPTIQGRLP